MMTKLISKISLASLYAFSNIACCQGRRLLEKQTGTTTGGVVGTGAEIASSQKKKAPWDISNLDTDNWGEKQWDDWWKKLATSLKSSKGDELGDDPNKWPEWTAESKKAARTAEEDKLLKDYLAAKKRKRKENGNRNGNN
jgi:hypothetical protein